MTTATLQTVFQALTEGIPKPATTQAAILVGYGEDARAARSAQIYFQVINEGIPKSATTKASILVLYRTGSAENLKNRSWTFTLDGHTFYVLTVGEQGTFVYDLTTEQWAQWKTGGLNTWNMEIGTPWRGLVVAADQQNPTIWQLTPLNFLDDGFKPIVRIVTGGLFMRQRTQVPNYAFRITASLGVPEVPLTAPETVPTVTLEFSDDEGKSFTNAGAITLVTGLFKQKLQWLSLGTMDAPLRIFKITDVGAIVRIDGGDAEVEEDEDRG